MAIRDDVLRPRRYGVSLAILACLGAGLLAPASRAGEPPKGGKDAKPGSGQYVDLSPVGVPVISQGRLVNYVFLVLRLNLKTGIDATKMRQKEPFFRDALVRLSHRTPLNSQSDLNHLDDRLVKTRMLAESTPIAGPGAVTTVEIVSETAQRRLTPPAPAKPPAATPPAG